jgi:translocation and assembly module TamA
VRLFLLVLIVAILKAPLSMAADPQSYSVELVSTGDHTLDATLDSASQLVALRKSGSVDPFGLIARATGDAKRLRTVLRSFGYYQGSVSILINGLAPEDSDLADTLTALPAGTDAHCRITVNLGPLYHVGVVSIDGELPDVARRAFGVTMGTPAVASDVLAGASRVLAALEDHGFAFAKVDPPIAYEDPDKHVLNLSLHVESGPSVMVGEIRIEGLKRVHESLLRKRLLLHTGEMYSATKVEQARKDLFGLGVFSAVNVSLAEAPDPSGHVSLTFQVQERLRHAVGLHAAYSSDLGGSGGVSWSDRNVFGNAEQLSLSASVINIGGNDSTGTGYDLSAKLIVPEIWRRDQSLQFSIGAIKQSLQAYDQTAQTAGMTIRRKLSSLWTVSVGATGAYEDVVQEGETHVYTLLALPLGIFYDSTDLASPLDDPHHGMRASLNLAPTFSFGNPNATFGVAQATISTYIDLGWIARTEPGYSVIAMRALSGIARGAGEYDLPPDQRFYAGGSGTIRGYRYQSVGPSFPDGNPIGGTAINAVSVELRQRFGSHLGAALFLDGGQVSKSSDPLSGGLRVGAGAGVRYYTPLGPVRFDVAFPTKRRPGEDDFEVYVGLGQAF